ncbi:hypothetical protein ACLOJK_021549 [Asimina triloba]
MENSSSPSVDQPQQQQRSWWSTPGISRRPVNSTNTSSSRSRAPPAPVIHPDIDPPPTPRPVAQFLAFALILFFTFLQFLPATHFRDPSDPLRSWIPYDSSAASQVQRKLVIGGEPDAVALCSQSSVSRAPNGEISRVASAGSGEAGSIHVVSWVDCLDLRMLAVLANSTLSHSRYPEHIHFHFFIPDGYVDKVSYYKLKVLFPDSNLEILGQEEVKQKLNATVSVGEYTMPSIHALAPFIIPITHPSLSRFIYVSPDIILKGSIEELFETDLVNYGIAATEDCSKHLGDYVSFDVLDAIQRVSVKPWVSMKPYERTACPPNHDVLLISARKFEKDILESILWWTKLLNIQHKRNNQINPAVALALYGKHLKLSTAWIVGDSTPTPQKLNDDGKKVLRFDGPRNVCSPEHDNHDIQHSNFGNLWEQYLPPTSSGILVN